MTNNSLIHNQHLPGTSFFWEGGSTGILLSHGYTATTAEVRPVAQLLHTRGFTVAGPLLPGHGTDPLEMIRYRWQDWAVALEQSYRELAQRCDTVFIGGESMGGLLSLYLANKYPGNCRSAFVLPGHQITPPDPAPGLYGSTLYPTGG
jgi:carboxylesterase